MSRYTGVGSTWHASASEAAAYVLERFPDFPFWPQVGGRMIDEALAEPSPESIPGFFELEKRLSPGAWLKGQVAGPATLVKCGKGEFAPLAAAVTRHAVWQAKRILALGRLPVIAIDEPSWTAPLGAEERKAAAAMLAEVRAAGAVVGVHCCGRADWADVLSLRPDFVNPDVSNGAKAFVEQHREALKAHLSGGGWIGWGLVPTDRPVPLGKSRAILKEFLAAIGPLGEKTWVLERSFLTPACGLATLTTESAEEVLRALFEVSRFLRCDHLGLPAH